ncbi:hypothetical protein, partial [Mesorhizobium sp. M7A.F.Ca.US.006.04.2.1]|uniref:hypothetical protein n=1 Tax=Mesorhizobium sp. M7A.F.Ca.US.006.04.2.1 TaxID=2496696 RepID=UPI0019D4BE32
MARPGEDLGTRGRRDRARVRRLYLTCSVNWRPHLGRLDGLGFWRIGISFANWWRILRPLGVRFAGRLGGPRPGNCGCFPLIRFDG